MHETEITIDAGGNRLSGTYCAPGAAGQYPVVLMIHGSGPSDRDENLPGQNLNVFNTIAHYLAGIGIASLRYDKRGCGASTGDYYRTGHYDLVDDAICWFDALTHRGSTMGQQVFLLGHSEGAIIVPQVCLKRESAAGLILLCPFSAASTAPACMGLKQTNSLRVKISFPGMFKARILRTDA